MSTYELAGLRDQAAGLRATISRWEAWRRRVDQLRADAEAAFVEHGNRLQAITNEMIELQQAVTARGTVDIDGYPHRGPTGAERVRYEILEAARAAEEQRYQRWVADAQIQESDAVGLDRSWSPRNPSGAARQQSEARHTMALLGQRLAEVEGKISALSEVERIEEASAAPLPAPDERPRSGLARIFGG